TPPEDEEKKKILKKYGFDTIYKLSLDDAVSLGLVSPYRITVVETRLDDSNKYIEVGKYSFTEKARYDFLTKTINGMMFKRNKTPTDYNVLKFKTFDRMRLIYNLESKIKAAKWLLEGLIPK